MRSFLLLSSILLGLLGWLTLASSARADSDTFLNAARAAGYTQEDDELLRNGFLVCAAQSQEGVNDDLVLRGIEAAQRWLNRDTNEERDQVFIDLAEKFLCPSEAENR